MICVLGCCKLEIEAYHIKCTNRAGKKMQSEWQLLRAVFIVLYWLCY
jgi:hypothetical protein